MNAIEANIQKVLDGIRGMEGLSDYSDQEKLKPFKRMVEDGLAGTVINLLVDINRIAKALEQIASNTRP